MKNKNHTNLSLYINKKLKNDFKQSVKKNNLTMKEVLKEEIEDFINQYKFNQKENKYKKNEEILFNIELPSTYKERLFEIILEDNKFFKVKEIVIYIIKKYIEKVK